MKWWYDVEDKDRRKYSPSEIIVGYDRLGDKWITLDQVFVVTSVFKRENK